jgi:hypothetical protein
MRDLLYCSVDGGNGSLGGAGGAGGAGGLGGAGTAIDVRRNSMFP